MPRRIQLRRTRGYRKPGGAVVVARPSKWGNPFRVRSRTIYPPGCPPQGVTYRDYEGAVAAFSHDLRAAINDPWGQPHTIEMRIMAESLHELRGKDLACWCPVGSACHADVLLELANREDVTRSVSVKEKVALEIARGEHDPDDDEEPDDE